MMGLEEENTATADIVSLGLRFSSMFDGKCGDGWDGGFAER